MGLGTDTGDNQGDLLPDDLMEDGLETFVTESKSFPMYSSSILLQLPPRATAGMAHAFIDEGEFPAWRFGETAAEEMSL